MADVVRSGIELSVMEEPHHRVVEEWMGRQVETLEDLLAPGMRAVRYQPFAD